MPISMPASMKDHMKRVIGYFILNFHGVKKRVVSNSLLFSNNSLFVPWSFLKCFERYLLKVFTIRVNIVRFFSLTIRFIFKIWRQTLSFTAVSWVSSTISGFIICFRIKFRFWGIFKIIVSYFIVSWIIVFTLLWRFIPFCILKFSFFSYAFFNWF